MAMKPGMRMMLADRVRQPENYSRSEYGGGNRRMIGYDRGMDGNATTSNYGGMETENRRRRDSRGRYMEGGGGAYNGGYDDDMPNMGGYGYGGTEARRRRDSRGRYMMGGMDYEDEPHSYSPHMMGGSSYGDIYAKGTIYAPGAMNRSETMGSEMSRPVDEQTARMWVSEMDGGEKFKPEQIEQLRMAMCPECGKWEFYTAINAMYSDHCKTAKAHGMDKPDFYAGLARDFLMDEDAKPHKLRLYMKYIAK